MDNLTGSDSSKSSVLLIASQMPQQELGLIAQLLQSQGFARKQPASPQSAPSLTFADASGANTAVLKFYQDIGALRLELAGDVSLKIGAALGQYMEPLTADRLGECYQNSNSDMDRRICAILLVLTFPDASSAMNALRKTYFDEANGATREGIVQGLAFLETPDAGEQLEILERDFKDTPIAKLCRKAIDGLSDRGVIRESITSFKQKIAAIVEQNPKSALESLEKYDPHGQVAELRALRAKALRLLGRNAEAADLLAQISAGDPDAADAWCERALAREAQGFAADALGDAQSALSADPQNALARDICNRLSLALGDNNAAPGDRRAKLDALIGQSPDDPNLRIQRAELLLETAPETAADDLKIAQKFAPNDPRLPLLLAKAWYAMRRLGAALEQATIALKTHTPAQETDALFMKPRVCIAIGDPQSALNAIRDIPQDQRENTAVVFCTAIIFEMLGRTAEAEAFYKTHADKIRKLFDIVRPRLYADLPLLRAALGADRLAIEPKPASPLDLEPVDPLFKRCKSCGALTIKRRTQCRECACAEFF